MKLIEIYSHNCVLNEQSQDLEDFMNSSVKGVVFLSLGTNVLSSLMDENKQKMIVDAFAQFPEYNFIWKFEETSTNIELPKNVIIRKWCSQSDILAHSKTKAFFTHCGLFISIEKFVSKI